MAASVDSITAGINETRHSLSKNDLVIISLIADALDILVVGQIPDLSSVIDVPVIIIPVTYAGPPKF